MNSDYREEDLFDRVPDALVRVIFNKLHDAKSLCRCMLVCKRFGSIIPQIDTVVLTIPPRNSIPINKADKELSDRSSKSSSRGLQRRLLKSLISKVILKPLCFLLQIIKSKSSLLISGDGNDYSFYAPNEVLKNFNEIMSLHIELPSHGVKIGSNCSDTLLKWKAEFGSKLESCVILGATSFYKKANNNNGEEEHEQRDSSFTISNDDLKLRVVWTISCLIAASARHYLLQEVVSKHRMLGNVLITDANKQGRLCMGNEQIEELRNSMDSEELPPPSFERTRVPALRMKLWYVPVLELPASGCVMKGATLVVIRPVDGAVKVKKDGDLVAGAFDGEDEEEAFGEAVRKMLKKKKACTLEMNAF